MNKKNALWLFQLLVLIPMLLGLCSISSTVNAQKDSLKLIKGIVVDENEKPIERVTVQVVGTSKGTFSDEKGEFQIMVAKGNKIEFSYFGKVSKSITYDGESTLSITLLNDEKGKLEEVTVVSTGYQNLDRKLFTGASAKLNAKDAERSGVPDVSRMLEGQIAGVSVQNVSGTFGAAPKIRIRGATSLNGDNKPL